MSKILIVIYNVLLIVISPFFFLTFFILNMIKNKKGEGYVYKFFPAAFNPLQKKSFQEGIWIHAVSLGEMRAAVKFIDLLKSKYGKKIYLSATTKTGFDFADNIYKNDDSVLIFYFPYDFLFSVHSILKLINPTIFISVETEIWPNLFIILKKKNIPIALINARISEKSYNNYIRFKFFFGYIFKKIDAVLCISDNYCERFASLGVKKENMLRTGNMKFDIDASLIAKDIEEKSKIIKKFVEFKTVNSVQTVYAKSTSVTNFNVFTNAEIIETFDMKTAKIIAAGSTHKGEEQIIIDSVIKLNKTNDKSKIFLFLAPRHQERFNEVYKLLSGYSAEIEIYKLSSIYESAYGYGLSRNNEPALKINSKIIIVLVDIIGQLLTVYSICNVAFVGGSLVPTGGHNLLEPLIFGKPVIFGEFVQNFSEVSEEIIKNDAGRQVYSSLELYEALADYLFNDKSAKSAGKNGLNIITNNKGVSIKNIEYLNYKGYLRLVKNRIKKSVDKIIKTD
ncbi:MAG: 3-deoxy-D-manno-octulosonic acid transferase [Candidatus Acidulodesulfobacterium sp.]